MGFNSAPPPPCCLVYYCSGHGYGHATRVSAFARALLGARHWSQPTVHIVSSAPEHVFSDSLAQGALYRFAEIDPVVVQPLAYQVDRRKSVDVLKKFLANKPALLERERQWLLEIGATAVLSDAAFLGCLAAKSAGIPSILITNFTFDSVYSYLSLQFVDEAEGDQYLGGQEASFRDQPIPRAELEPLVAEISSGYRCADALVILPGYIPIPSFFDQPRLPAPDWVDSQGKGFHPWVEQCLSHNSAQGLLPPVPFPTDIRTRQRKVFGAPLLVRPCNSACYTLEGRRQLLDSIGVSEEHQQPGIKILVVSFGGQHFRQPSRPPSRTQSRNGSREYLPLEESPQADFQKSLDSIDDRISKRGHRRIATESYILVPGAPPASKTTTSHPIPIIQEPATYDNTNDFAPVEESHLLPDESWIAVICGVSKAQWLDSGEELPERFYIAPKDIYMPDLTAIGDVLLGKLGYGTVSECVETCTPFVYVSRPLFIEEHGLRRLLQLEGTGIELARASYEAGDWATTIRKAYEQGKAMKDKWRHDVLLGRGLDGRSQVGELARTVIDWICDWRA